MPPLQCKPILDKQKRQIAFCKKKKDIIQRLMDLSISCRQLVHLVIYDDKKHRMTTY